MNWSKFWYLFVLIFFANPFSPNSIFIYRIKIREVKIIYVIILDYPFTRKYKAKNYRGIRTLRPVGRWTLSGRKGQILNPTRKNYKGGKSVLVHFSIVACKVSIFPSTFSFWFVIRIKNSVFKSMCNHCKFVCSDLCMWVWRWVDWLFNKGWVFFFFFLLIFCWLLRGGCGLYLDFCVFVEMSMRMWGLLWFLWFVCAL